MTPPSPTTHSFFHVGCVPKKKKFLFGVALVTLSLVLSLAPSSWTLEAANGGTTATAASATTRHATTNSTTFSTTTTHSHGPQNPIRQISILGERNSGTRWTFDHLSECFGHALPVEKRLTRYKHWFQMNDSSRYPHDTLVIAQFRNPYDWLKAMERVPHHAPNHLRTMAHANYSEKGAENDWKVFLTRPWTMPRVGQDLRMHGNETCQEDFAYRDIISCVLEPLPPSHYNHTIRYSEHQPFYEMRHDGSGLPYANLLELRAAKIVNFLDVQHYAGVADVWRVQYEYLLNAGTQHLIDQIAHWTGVQPRCKGIAPQLRKPKKTRLVQPEMARHIRKHLNWTVEALIGYGVEMVREEAPREW